MTRIIRIICASITAGTAALAMTPAANAATGPAAPHRNDSGAVATTAIGGDWEGRYTCSQGLTGLDLKITRSGKSLSARFSFYPLASNPTVPVGIYTMRGTYRSASRIVLRRRRWILHPPGYVMVGLSGSLSRGRFRGRVHGPACTTFSLAKPTGHPRRSDVIDTWKGSYLGCSQGPTGLRLAVRRRGRAGDRLYATFNFYALKSNPSVPSGSYAMTGYYFPGGVALYGTHWIHQPPGYGMVNLVGRPPRRDGTTFRGAIVDCTTFSLKRH
jgi:hypothetical protein